MTSNCYDTKDRTRGGVPAYEAVAWFVKKSGYYEAAYNSNEARFLSCRAGSCCRAVGLRGTKTGHARAIHNRRLG